MKTSGFGLVRSHSLPIQSTHLLASYALNSYSSTPEQASKKDILSSALAKVAMTWRIEWTKH